MKTDILTGIDSWCRGSVSGELDAPAIGTLLKRYLADEGLGHGDPEAIQEAQRVLSRAIAVYAYRRSPVYADLDPEVLLSPDCLEALKARSPIGKADLLAKEDWFTPDFVASTARTSGSTGPKFEYRIWNDAYLPIERTQHYGLILEEFGVRDEPAVLYMVPGFMIAGRSYRTHQEGAATIKFAAGDDLPDNVLVRTLAGHGHPRARMHHIHFDESAFFHIDDYCNFVVRYCQQHAIDVLVSSGGFFEILCTSLISSNRMELPRICRLLSNTGDRVNVETLKFLVDAGVADHWCDHMRCWDGGAGFFTCREGNYHLNEDLAYVHSVGGRLASVDFFSYPSPFLNYENGDYCEVGDSWERCDCGRWSRPFRFLDRRPRSNLAGTGYYDTQEVHRSLTEKFGVKFVSYHDNLIVVEDSSLTPEAKEGIVREMATHQVVVQFFTQPELKAFGLMTKPGGVTYYNCMCQPGGSMSADDCAAKVDEEATKPGGKCGGYQFICEFVELGGPCGCATHGGCLSFSDCNQIVTAICGAGGTRNCAAAPANSGPAPTGGCPGR